MVRWVTRAGARQDRATMIWFIRRFIDKDAEIVFRPDGEVMAYAAEHGATPFHHPQAEFKHTGFRTGFESLLAKHDLHDPALTAMALIHRGAETRERDLTKWSPGVRAIGSGMRAAYDDDDAYVDAMGPVLDGLYKFCQELVALEQRSTPTSD